MNELFEQILAQLKEANEHIDWIGEDIYSEGGDIKDLVIDETKKLRDDIRSLKYSMPSGDVDRKLEALQRSIAGIEISSRVRAEYVVLSLGH